MINVYYTSLASKSVEHKRQYKNILNTLSQKWQKYKKKINLVCNDINNLFIQIMVEFLKTFNVF